MGNIKIHEIAKELGVNSKEVLEKAKKLGIEVKSHLSSVDEEIAKKIRGSFKEKEEKPVAKNKKEVKKDKNATEGHVIIRREVIVSEENKKPEKSNANKNVGFGEQTRNKDYNIVYRNKQTRPMTVNELFGIPNKKEEKKAQPVQKSAEPVKVEKEIKVEKEKEEVKKVEKVESVKVENNHQNQNQQHQNNPRRH